MKRRYNSKKPHEPHALYLDEGISGPTLHSILRKAGIFVFQYEGLNLEKNKKISDGAVIKRACESNFILVTRDGSMEWDDGLQDIICNKAKIIILTDQEGGPAHWASALICAEKKWRRVLLDNPIGPLTISVNRDGTIKKVTGEAELLARRNKILTGQMGRAKRHRRISQSPDKDAGTGTGGPA